MTVIASNAALTGCATADSGATGAGAGRSNPLLAVWDTPFGTPPYPLFETGDWKPAFEAAMAENLREIDAIASDTRPASFATVFDPYERSGRTLARIASAFFNLTGAHTNEQIQEIEGWVAPKLADHGTAITQNAALFARIKAVHDSLDGAGLRPDQTRLVQRTYQGFVKGGAQLQGEARARVAAIDSALAGLQVEYGKNQLKGQSDWHLPLASDADFAGLPDSLADACRAAARERGVAAAGIVTLSRSSFEPFLTFSTRRDLREAVQKGWMAVGSTDGNDNRGLVRQILDLRLEKARLMGFDSFASYQLSDKMARTPERAMAMMDQVWNACLASARRELGLLQARATADGFTGPLQSWDWWHYAEKVRLAEYNVDETQLKPYFELSNMIEAMFWNATQLFGLTFQKREGIPTWHPDVVAYEVFDRNGRPKALWFGDFYARQSKQSGAWMSSFVDQQRLTGDVKPVVFNVCNYSKPEPGKPTLLGFDDVVTLFHEFGHALHGILSDVTYPSQSGTNVVRDFVEFPSQVLEHWVTTPEILNRFAKHYETGAPIPRELVDRLLAAKNFNQGWSTTEYLSAAIMDMKMHMITAPAPSDIDAWEKQLLDGIGLIPQIVVRYRPGYFGHTFQGGYAAGYYSYIWASVLETDAFNAFEERGNVYDPALAESLTRNIFAAGDTRDPMEMYVSFRGREPAVGALIEARGLVGAN